MANDSQLKIRRDLRRQRGLVVYLLDALDEKNLGKQQHNAALEKRRRYYQPKKNGRGRPARKLQLVSNEDEARRVQYVAEIALLDEAVEFNPANADRFLDWLAILKDEKGEDEDWRARQRKIERLMDQFRDKPMKAIATRRIWDPDDIHDYVTILHERQRGRVQIFAHLPVCTPAQQDEEDGERAELAALERLASSNHFATPDLFRSRAHMIRSDVVWCKDLHDRDVYRAAWFQAIDEIVGAVMDRFCVS